MTVIRFGVSIETELLEALDEFVKLNHFPNRSRAIRYLMEKNLVEHKWKCNNQVVGSILLVYEVNNTELITKITQLLYQNKTLILSSQKFFLKENVCMEMIAIRGMSHELTEFSELLITLKGISRGKLLMSRL